MGGLCTMQHIEGEGDTVSEAIEFFKIKLIGGGATFKIKNAQQRKYYIECFDERKLNVKFKARDGKIIAYVR